MKRLKQIFAWIAIIMIAGLLIATLVLSIQGSQLSLPMLGLTMGISVLLWVLLWFMSLVAKKADTTSVNRGKTEEESPKETSLSAEAISGYLLPELKEKLKPEVYTSLESTNNTCKEYGMQGKPEGIVVVAQTQTAGRGRMGRTFYSPPDSGVYISFLMRPDLTAQDSLLITTAAAVAAAETIEEVLGEKAEIKWVNDVYCHGRKVCGILTEASAGAGSDKPDYAVMGIGFNIREPKGGFPEEIKDVAGAILNKNAEAKLPYSDEDIRSRMAAGMMNHFWIYYETLTNRAFMPEYKKRSFLLGRQVKTLTEPPIYGKAVDIDDAGGLILICEDGSRQILSSGEISVRPVEETDTDKTEQ